MSFLRRFYGSQRKRDQTELAEVEISEISEILPEVFSRNLSCFHQLEGSTQVAMEMVLAKPFRDISGLFALGVAMEVIEKLPPLPTPPYDRAYIHILNFFAKNSSFLEGQSRIVAIKEQFESLDKTVAYIVALGRKAVDDDDPSYLARCYVGAYKNSLLKAPLNSPP